MAGYKYPVVAGGMLYRISAGIGSATTFALTAPSTITYGSTITVSVTPNGTYTGTITLDVSSWSNLASQTLTWSGTSDTKSHTFTPTAAGSFVVTGRSSTHLEGAPFQTYTDIHPTSGNSYYVSPSGAGAHNGTSPSNAWAISDLFTAGSSSVVLGVAQTSLYPGDTLYFLAGDYSFDTGSSSDYGVLRVARSGTATAPITYRPNPGAAVNLHWDAGVPCLIDSSGTAYVRYIGFNVDNLNHPDPYPNVITPTFNAEFGPGEVITDHYEVGWCTFTGRTIQSTDNYGAIVTGGSQNLWAHHLEVTGYKQSTNTTSGFVNTAAIRFYSSTGHKIEDCYLHDNDRAVYDKSSNRGSQTIAGFEQGYYTRNYFVDNRFGCWIGTTQPAGSWPGYHIYDNFWDGTGVGMLQGTASVGDALESQDTDVYNNIFINDNQYSIGGGWNNGINNWEDSKRFSAWNNINLVSLSGLEIAAFSSTSDYVASGTNATISYMDYNLYDTPTHYRFGLAGTPSYYTLTQIRAEGFEVNSVANLARSTIFSNPATYVLNPTYLTTGRYGDCMGPRIPFSNLSDTSRCGHSAYPF